MPSPAKASAPYQVSQLSCNRPLPPPVAPGPIRRAPEFENSPCPPPAIRSITPKSLQASDLGEFFASPDRPGTLGQVEKPPPRRVGFWPGPSQVVQASMNTLRAKCPSQDAVLCAKWHDLLQSFGTLSGLFVQTQASIHGMAHSNRILDTVAPSTIFFLRCSLAVPRINSRSQVRPRSRL